MVTTVEPIDPNRIYTVDETARILRLSKNTIYRLARAGLITSIQVGQRVRRFRGAALLAFIDGGGTPAPVNVIPDQVRRRPRMAS